MPTQNPRINITLDEDTAHEIQKLAKQLGQSVSSYVKELVMESLEIREDYALSKLAAKRDKKGARRVSHDRAWK